MKYGLKKDLPFAKVGAEVKIVSSYAGSPLHNYYSLSIKGDLIEEWYRIEIPKERFTDWVEEVKPREWWLVITNLGFETGFSSEELAIEYANQHCNNSGIIKVREVIE